MKLAGRQGHNKVDGHVWGSECRAVSQHNDW